MVFEQLKGNRIALSDVTCIVGMQKGLYGWRRLPDRDAQIAVVPPSYLKRNFCIIDIFVAYIFAGAVVNLQTDSY